MNTPKTQSTDISAPFPHEALTQWYHTHGRITLPWRLTDDPYHIYVSEIMLQQTQVNTVLDRYYQPFLERFPTLTALANAPIESVLKMWEGLGYYTRARNLHKAAQQCAPNLPDQFEELITLPGIGKNTAHAILAFAYHQPVAVMEANVKRIIHRLLAQEHMSDKELWNAASMIVNHDDPFTHNQAMMDIGATMCSVSSPQCMLCPLSSICAGKLDPNRYPAPKEKKATPTRKKHIIVFMNSENSTVYLSPRSTAFLGGLYGFPEYPDTAQSVELDGVSFSVDEMQYIGNIRQQYSHFTLEAGVWHCTLPASTSLLNISSEYWHPIKTLDDLPTSRADQKIIKKLKLLS